MTVAGINPMLFRIASSATPALGTAGRTAFGFFADELLADDGKSGPTSLGCLLRGPFKGSPLPVTDLRLCRRRTSQSSSSRTTLPWRTKPPEGFDGLKSKSRSRDRAFCLRWWRSCGASSNGARYLLPLGGNELVPSKHQGRPTNGRSSSVMLATSVQKLLDRTKRKKFSMPRSFSCRGDV